MFTSNRNIHHYNTRNRNNPHIETRKTIKISKTIRHNGPEIWYKIPDKIKESITAKCFTNKLKKYFLQLYSS